jgi:2-amino-4-hydroxy-6-hydroxymethyldihydropteridine diphosphokinase
MKTVYIGVGSNMGDPRRNCLDAIDRISGIYSCKNLSVSSLYLTEPVGTNSEDWFINCVLSASTDMPAVDFMKRLLDIESAMGRIRITRWGSRIIDLDLLLFGDDIIHEQILTVPHPMMHLRRFVMTPMVDLAPELIHPVLGITMKEIYNKISEDGQAIKRMEGA